MPIYAYAGGGGLADRTVVVGDVMIDVLLSVCDSAADAPSPVAAELGLSDGGYSLATYSDRKSVV